MARKAPKMTKETCLKLIKKAPNAGLKKYWTSYAKKRGWK